MNTIILTILPLSIIGLILLQKTNAGIQGDTLKASASPLTKRLQLTIVILVTLFLASSVFYSNQLQKIKNEENKALMDSQLQQMELQQQQLKNIPNKSFQELVK